MDALAPQFDRMQQNYLMGIIKFELMPIRRGGWSSRACGQCTAWPFGGQEIFPNLQPVPAWGGSPTQDPQTLTLSVGGLAKIKNANFAFIKNANFCLINDCL